MSISEQNYAHYGNSFLFLAFGEHEFPRITHELLMNYYYMEHYMGHYMCITCGVADKKCLCVGLKRISKN